MNNNTFTYKQIGNYKVIANLGEGGFGRVYKGQDITDSDAPYVAIKVLSDVYLETKDEVKRSEQINRFEQEAQFLNKLIDHPYILRYEGFGYQGETPYLVTEFAPNGSLKDLLSKTSSKPLPLQDALTILSQIGQALIYAHGQEPPIVHRDIKPENILFNSKGQALLADFGIATTLTEAKTKVGERAGTLVYMAPEQLMYATSIKSDQYSFGCVAYEMLTGKKAFHVDFVPQSNGYAKAMLFLKLNGMMKQ